MLKSIVPLSIVTFLSRITGFVREYLLYRAFGAGPLLDVFVVGFRMAQLTRRFFAEGSFTQALLPELAKVQGQPDRYKTLYHQAFAFLILCMGLYTAWVLMNPYFWVGFQAPGLLQGVQQHDDSVINLVRWVVPYGFFVSLVSFYALIMQLHHRYLLNGFSPIILNFAIIIVLLGRDRSLDQLGYAVFVAGFIQCLLQYLAGRRYAPLSFSGFKLTADAPPVMKSFLKLSVMGFIILVNTSVDQRFLTLSHQGSMSEYYLCERIVELPLGVIAYSLSIVFASYYAKYHHAALKRVQLENKAILFIFYFVLPCAVGGAMLAPYLIRVFLQNPISIERTTNLLYVFVLCIVPMTLNKINVLMASIRGQHNLVIKVHAVGMVVNCLGDYFLSSWSTVGIATSTMLTLLVQLFLFDRVFKLSTRFMKLPIRLLLPAVAALSTIVAGGFLFEAIDHSIHMELFSYLIVLLSTVFISGAAYLILILPQIRYLHSRFAY